MSAKEISPEPPRRHTGARWKEILDAATIEFRDRGYEGASVRDIARRVGILKGSLYNYITGKADLFVAVVEVPAEQIIEEVQNLLRSDDPTPTRLRHLIEVQVQLFRLHHPTPFIYLAHATNHLDPRFDEWDAQYLRSIEELLRIGIERGEFRSNLDVNLVARAFIGMLAWMLAWYQPRSEEDDERIIEQFWMLVIGGIAVPA